MSGGGARRVWGVLPEAEHSLLGSAQEIQNYLGCHPVIARLLWNRGLKSVQLLERFLKPKPTQLPDPYSILDMRKAVERIARAVLEREPIAVYGDYDVDGTCGSALLIDFFRSLGIEVVSYQPNRFSEGYGVHVAAVEKLADAGARCIISVDCGITAVEPAKALRAKGVDFIVIDHHKIGAVLPEAYAIIDPQRPEDESGLLNVCGAGLAFFFALALRSELRSKGYFENRAEPNVKRLLDLVAVATVADVVDIRGVNRILVSQGLEVMTQNPRIGLRALLDAAKVEKPNSMHCGFVIGPRINAAGRLKSARAAFDLLTSENAAQARELAQQLEEINLARRATQDDVLRQAREQARAQLEDPLWLRLAQDIPAAEMGPWPRALVLSAPEGAEGWHEGVVGIVASKVVEEFGRPVFILADKEGAEGTLKGSVRSIPKVDILAAISAETVARHLLNFGGHAHAGGVTLLRSNLQSFLEAVNLHLALTTAQDEYRRERRFDAEVELSEIDGRLVEELQMLEPFGHQFPEPVLKISNISCDEVRILKEKHLKLKLGRMDAIWFNSVREGDQAPIHLSLEEGERCSMWVSPQWNEWQGVRRLQLQVRHAELARG